MLMLRQSSQVDIFDTDNSIKSESFNEEKTNQSENSDDLMSDRNGLKFIIINNSLIFLIYV